MEVDPFVQQAKALEGGLHLLVGHAHVVPLAPPLQAAARCEPAGSQRFSMAQRIQLVA